MPQKTPSRCPWFYAGMSDAYLRYHDEEWGAPVHDDRRQFEFLVLEGAQAGLSRAPQLLADVSRIRARSVIEEHSLRVRERAVILWAGVLLASSALLGMLVGLPAFLLLYLRYRSAERWTVALAVAAGFWTLLYGVLVLLLRLPLYAGRLWSWL